MITIVIVHREFVPPGQTVNGEYYVGVIKRLLTRIRRVRSEYCLLHNNAPPHLVFDFLTKNRVLSIQHGSYSPDLAVFYFPKLNLTMKGNRFLNVDDIKQSSTGILNCSPPISDIKKNIWCTSRVSQPMYWRRERVNRFFVCPFRFLLG